MPPWLVRKYPEVTARARHRAADPVRPPPGRGLLPPGLPLPRRAHRAQGRRPLRRPPGGDRLPGRQRAGHGALPQPRRVPGLRRPPARARTGPWRRSTSAGGSSTGRTASPAGTSCGRRTATPSPPTTSPGAATSPRSRRDFIAWQAEIVRELARPDQFVTTCMALGRPAFDAADLNRRSTSRRSTPTTRCRTRSRCRPRRPARPRRSAGSATRAVVDLPAGGHDARRARPGAVPRDGDQRARHRRVAPELPRLRRPVAPGGLGARGPRRAHGRVLALALDPLRPRGVLARRAQPRRRARPLLRRGGADRRRASSAPGEAVVDLEPEADVGDPLLDGEPLGAGVPARRWPRRTADAGPRSPTTASSTPSTRACSPPKLQARLVFAQEPAARARSSPRAGRCSSCRRSTPPTTRCWTASTPTRAPAATSSWASARGYADEEARPRARGHARAPARGGRRDLQRVHEPHGARAGRAAAGAHRPARGRAAAGAGPTGSCPRAPSRCSTTSTRTSAAGPP